MDTFARGETAEHHLDALITKRHDQRVRDEGERREEAATRALANGEAIAARHRAQIEALLGNGHEEGNGHHH